MNIFFRITVAILIVLWWLYWRIQEKIADREKPKTQTQYPLVSFIGKYVFFGMIALSFVQLLGLSVLSFVTYSSLAAWIGFLCVVCGVIICIVARRTLAANWANGYEYQIKKGHELITSGIYGYIRHPIYTGIAFIFIGAELVAQSYLWISYLSLFVAFFVQGRREEKLLFAYFGKQYKDYMKKTKMLIPFVF